MSEEDLYIVYRGVVVPKAVHTPESLQHAEEFNVREGDVFVATYPKSGTTWMQEILTLVTSGGDFTPVLTLPNWDRVPWLEEHRTKELKMSERPSPRTLSTHLHYHMMPKSFYNSKAKVIYVLRNPKDIYTSSYFYYQMATFLVDPGTPDEFLMKFLDGKVMFGSWFDHVKGWLSAKEQVLYISYEEMIADLKGSVSKVCTFLDKPLSEEVIEKIADHCTFKNMKQNKMSNYSLVPEEFMDQKKSTFLRKGISGDWKNVLTVAQAELFDSVYKEKMKGIEYKFYWDEN
ncbi:sulfotransferase 2B1-like isoform X2 [Polypterus senegalus]|uniref:sulfotransferase 2B1-like isoform X2 n=1 Tax=Polypterus senegalus TaxID=55291 RepID=UPI0019648042|nr:sulfotransferase 2B1-like isoform X2 [Polypterus senegalus]